MTDNVMLPQKVNVVTPNFLRLHILITVEDKWIITDRLQNHVIFVKKTANISGPIHLLTATCNDWHMENNKYYKRWYFYCYTLTQNTCVRLVQIASRDVNKYALLPVK